MQDKLFVVGDVHGQLTQLKELLRYWNKEEEILLFIGDLGDRGENPKACFELVKDLVENHGAVCLRGNHEDMLMAFLNTPAKSADLFERNGGGVTIQSFLKEVDGTQDAVEIAAALMSQYPWLKTFLNDLPIKVEWGKYVFTHAGVDLTRAKWEESSDRDFVWIREGFYDQENRTDRVFVFGHTVTATLHEEDLNTDIWETSDGKIGIDGGAVYGGPLHGVVFDQNKIVKKYKVANTGYAFSERLRKG